MKRKNYIALLKLGFPILIGQLGLFFVAFADNIMVGRYSTEAFAASSFVNSVFNLANLACIGFTYGLTPIVAALFSQGKKFEIGSVMKAAVQVNMLFMLAIYVILGVVYFNVEHLGQPAELMPLIRPYYLIILVTLLPNTLFNLFSQWSYAVGNSKGPMWIMLFSNVLNIVGNYTLIYGNLGAPELGLTGAGISTLIARMVCPAILLPIFFFSKANAEYAKGFFASKCTKSQRLEVFRTSYPISMQMSMESGSFSVVGVMAGWIGTVAMASFQIIVIVGTLGFCIYYSFGAAIAALVGNARGLDNSNQMKSVAAAGYHIILVLAAISSIIFYALGPQLISVFTTDKVVIATTITLIVPLLLYQLGDATQITFAGALRGTGNVMPMLWIAFVSYVVIGIPASYILAFTAGLGIYGLILSFSFSLFPAGIGFAYFFYKNIR